MALLGHPVPTTGVHSGEVILASLLALFVSRLLSLDLLGIALSLLEKLLVLRFDLGCPVLGLTAAASAKGG